MDEFCIDSISIIGGANMSDPICEVVASLPGEVKIWVVENITFIDMSGISGLATSVCTSFPSEVRGRKDEHLECRLLIVLCPEEAEDDDRARFRIAHEIAHHWCGHSESHSCDLEEAKVAYEKQEEEADSLANEWGYPGNSIRVV